MKLLTTSEVSEILQISRMHVTRLIKSGKIPATKVGRSYIIRSEDIGILADQTTSEDRKIVTNAVRRVVKEYGETLKKLGEE